MNRLSQSVIGPRVWVHNLRLTTRFFGQAGYGNVSENPAAGSSVYDNHTANITQPVVEDTVTVEQETHSYKHSTKPSADVKAARKK